MNASSTLDSSSRSTKSQNECYNCGKPGGLMRDCRARKQRNGRQLKWCSFHRSNKFDTTECKDQMNDENACGSSGKNSKNRQGNNRNNIHNRNRSNNNNNQDIQNYGPVDQANINTTTPTTTTVPMYINVQRSIIPTAATIMEPSLPSGVACITLLPEPSRFS